MRSDQLRVEDPGIGALGRERVGDGLRLLLAQRGESGSGHRRVDQHCGVARRLAVPHEVDDDRLPVAATTDRGHAAGTDEPPATTDSPIDPASPAGSAQAAVAEQQRLAPGAAVTADTARATHAAVAHQPAAGAAHAAHSAGKAGATGTPVAD